jgi:hypothetical protein
MRAIGASLGGMICRGHGCMVVAEGRVCDQGWLHCARTAVISGFSLLRVK